jgi:hypothetical protein
MAAHPTARHPRRARMVHKRRHRLQCAQLVRICDGRLREGGPSRAGYARDGRCHRCRRAHDRCAGSHTSGPGQLSVREARLALGGVDRASGKSRIGAPGNQETLKLDIQRRNRRTRRTKPVFSACSARSALIVVAGNSVNRNPHGQSANQRREISTILQLCGGPSANVIVPSITDLPFTRATPFRRPIRLRSRTTSTSMTTTSPGRTGRRYRTRSIPMK